MGLYHKLVARYDAAPVPYNLTVELIEWCKANAIHKWFLDNVQNGVDDCEEYQVSVEQLSALCKILEKCLARKSRAPKLLPTYHTDSFFGPIDYGDYYWDNIKTTYDCLVDVLSRDNSAVSFFYSADW